MAADHITLSILEEKPSKNERRASKLKRIVTLKTLIDQQEKHYLAAWNMIFLFACVVAVMIDPLFFYIPVINDEKKCLRMDKKLWTGTLVLRSVMDITYVLHIILKIRSGIAAEESERSKTNIYRSSKNSSLFWGVFRRIWLYLLIDFLAILPIPQVLISLYLPKTKISRSSDNRKLLNFILLIQYLPRIYRIHLTGKEYTDNPSSRGKVGTASAKGLFNFFLYIIASHVAGAFWYLFAIERETQCWQYACEQQNGCNLSKTFYCDDFKVDQTTINFLNDSCPVNPTNATLFDFGIFTSVLQSGIVASPTFARKFLYSFGWGLRNLSSFGSNLQTSTNIWENLFADSITITGLLLFIYLLGNLQTYLQLSALRSDERDKIMNSKEKEINRWIEDTSIDHETKKDIMKWVREKLAKDKEVNLKTLFNILPTDIKRNIKHNLCFTVIKEVLKSHNVTDEKLSYEIIANHLKPVIFKEQAEFVLEGKPIDRVLFFTRGSVLTHTSCTDNNATLASASSTGLLGKGEFYGKEMLESVIRHKSLSNLPMSGMTLKASTNVEAFALTADTLVKFVNKYSKHFGDNNDSVNSGSRRGTKLLGGLSVPKIDLKIMRQNDN